MKYVRCDLLMERASQLCGQIALAIGQQCSAKNRVATSASMMRATSFPMGGIRQDSSHQRHRRQCSVDQQLSFQGESFHPTAAPVLSAPTLPENPALKADLLQHMSGFEENLSDPNSPAYQAYLWLANSKGFEELDLSRKLQRFGLVAFYKSTTPDYDWKVSNRWQTHQHECGWFGITCAVDDTVTEISLPRNRMSGSIPPEIALVGLGGQLGKLDLSGNHIGGELPEQLGTLTHLEMLDLRNNDFTGPIPPELGQLSMLKSLALQANELSGDMPNQVCSLAIGSGLVELMADCDPADPFSKVTCDLDTCCTHCD
ncbi:hypothetical protein ACHAXT_012673 [Thalassiosira profunda]